MKCAVNLFEIFPVNMCIDLGCGDIGVTKQFLDSPDISAALEKVSGKGMSDRVWTGMFSDPSLDDILAEYLPESHAC